MSPRPHAAGRARAARAAIALAVVSASLGAVAFAATRPERGEAGLGASKPVALAPAAGADPHGSGPSGPGTPKGEEQLPRARFLEQPEPISTATETQFRFNVPPRSPLPDPPPPPGPAGEAAPARRFQCQVDGSDWSACGSPYRLTGLALGTHSFAVRARARSGRPGPPVGYSWRHVEAQVAPAQGPDGVQPNEQIDPKPFSIESQAGGIEDLYPGHPAQQLPVQILNPNTVPIEVTSLTAAIASEPPDCPAENFELSPSSASASAPVVVPAGGSVGLPSATATAPAIGLLNLPVNQDSCRGVEVQLVFSGEAHG